MGSQKLILSSLEVIQESGMQGSKSSSDIPFRWACGGGHSLEEYSLLDRLEYSLLVLVRTSIGCQQMVWFGNNLGTWAEGRPIQRKLLVCAPWPHHDRAELSRKEIPPPQSGVEQETQDLVMQATGSPGKRRPGF